MFHLDDGTLRRLLDEPHSTLSLAQVHYEQCAHCRGRAAALRANADAVSLAFARAGGSSQEALSALAAREGPPQAELSLAIARARRRNNSQSLSMLSAARPRPRRSTLSSGLIAAAFALIIVALLLFTPLGTVAQGFLTIFEPHQFQPVAISPIERSSLRFVPDLTAYGTVRELARSQSVIVAGPAQAAALAHMGLRVPNMLPKNISGPGQWRVSSGHSVLFTFSAAKAAASAAARHQSLPPMPPGLNGSSLQITLGPVVTTTFGAGMERRWPSRGERGEHGDYPGLLIVQAPLPRVLSTGASVRQIEQYVLRQPGIPPRLAAQILAISDPTSTLPIPVPIDKASAQQALVQGVRGLAVGDNTGIGAGVIWQRDGYIYGVAGPFPESEILAIANSLR